MKTQVAVMASDAVNLKNMRADTGSLYTAIKDNFERGLPQLISHNRHRLAGWVVPSALHFSPGLTQLLANVYEPESEEDTRTLLRFAARHMTAECVEIPDESRHELARLLGSKLTGTETTWNVGAHALRSPGLAQRCFPDLFGCEDKDGLVPLDGLAMIRPGIFQIGELCIFAHPYLRRSESALNQFNVELLDTLVTLESMDSVRARVRLDPDLVGLAKTAPFPIELDHWYGPKFNNDLSAIASGVTVHSADEVQRVFHELSRTEFWWQRRKNDSLRRSEMILEAEELRDSESGSHQDKFRCRYVHSVIDENSKRIEHLDGAIRAYDDAEMLSRLEQNLMHVSRKTDYTKLWRVDGTLDISHWKTLIHSFFRGNPLVAEYFGQPPGTSNVQSITPERQENPPSGDKLVPWACDCASDFQVMLTRRPRLVEELACDRAARPTQWASNSASDIPLFDFRFLELKKILVKAGQSVDLPDGARFLLFHDNYIEMPLLMHRHREALAGTVTAYRQFLTELNRKCEHAVLCIEIGLAKEHFVDTLSLFGRVTEIGAWMNRDAPFPPDVNVEDWVRDAAAFMDEFSPASSRSRGFNAVFEEELVLHPRRVSIPRGRWTATDGQLIVESKDLPIEVAEILNQNDIKLAACDRVDACRCDLCGQDFLSCPCSTLLDNATPELNRRFAFPYWIYP